MKNRLEDLNERLSMSAGTRGAISLTLFALVACGGGDGTTDDALSTFVTEAEYQFWGAPESDVTFLSPFVRADPAEDRVFVVDRGSSQISVWSPDGLLRNVVGGHGEEPNELATAGDLFIDIDGTSSAVDWGGSRFTYFAADGEHLRTALGPGTSIDYEGFDVRLAPPREGVYVGTARVPPGREVGARGMPGMDREPLVRVRRSDTGQWTDPEPLFWLDIGNRVKITRMPGGGGMYSGQPFGDFDRIRLRPGAAVVMRQNGAPGAVELIEVSGQGDTVWHRHLQFEPQELTRQMVDDALDQFVDSFGPGLSGRMSSEELRERIDEALYKPEYLPTAEEFVVTASGDVWLRTSEVSDTLRTHYVVPRGDPDGAPRRVLLPEWLRIGDATGTHVWGVRRDAMDVAHVVGRRLVATDQ